ncbi:MAG: LysM peptidoglycan-binding domain-containing protein [Acidiferrobacterales bacterium]
MVRRILSFAAVLGLLLSSAAAAQADTVAVQPDHPQRYTVVSGDTLWGISARFLKDPWQWAKVWTVNPQIRNPDLIYPGNVIVFSYVNGKPRLTLLRSTTLAPVPGGEAAAPAVSPSTSVAQTPPVSSGAGASLAVVKLEPQVRSEPIRQAIPTISPTVIGPFLTRPLVVSSSQLRHAPYVAEGLNDQVVLGTASKFYARRLGTHPAHYYQIFRQGKALKDPDSGKTLGYQAIYLGRATLLTPGDPAKLVITRARQEIFPRDLLVAAPRRRPPMPYYFPHPPAHKVRGRIISGLNDIEDFGPLSVVAIDLGHNEDINEGDVLRILRHGNRRTDPETHSTYHTPNESEGLLMVFRVFDKVSYALIMSATGPVHMDDVVTTP